jgi:peptidoglycan/xylan/chitin deacetylase (PgdA/CDA1 family)
MYSKMTRRLAKKSAAAMALALALTACGTAAESPAVPEAPLASEDAVSVSGPSPDAPAGNLPPSAPASGSPQTTQPQSSQTAAPPAADTPPPTEEIAEPKYRMNKAYRIVPIDKTAVTDKVVLLTFDDGPKDAAMLGKILDTLDKHNAKAIFFVNGYRVKANPDLLKEIDARGQVIGNHSYDHINLKKETDEKIREQIESVQQLVKEITGKTPKFFRPPHGASNETVKAVARENGMLFMTWSNGSLDWDLGKKVSDKPQAVIDNVMEQLHPGSNILMHELEWTADALDRLLSQLEEKGYSFVDPGEIAIDLEE